MANRSKENVKRFAENISKEMANDAYNGGGSGGGTVIVTELPETGEEHTIYELHQTAEPAYNWVAMCTQQMMTDRVAIASDVMGMLLVFDTYAQMTNVFGNITITGLVPNILVYLKNEDKLYDVFDDGGEWGFNEIVKESNYIFGPLEWEDAPLTYILKSYEGYDETDDRYYGTLYDGTKVRLDIEHKGFILHQTSICAMSIFTCVIDVQEIPLGPTVYTEIPYSDIIQNPGGFQEWAFKPEQGGEKVSYWIYENNEWVNIDEIPDPNTVKIGITCTNGTYSVLTLPLNTITVTYDGVDYNVTQYAVTEVATEVADTVTYYGYIEVSMPTQDNLTHTIKVSTTEATLGWMYKVLPDLASGLNEDYPTEVQGILSINIYYQYLG